jgi:hypothetical protein
MPEVLSLREQCALAQRLRQYYFGFDDLVDVNDRPTEKRLLAQLLAQLPGFQPEHLSTDIKTLETTFEAINAEIERINQENDRLRATKWVSFFYTKSTECLEAAKHYIGCHLTELKHLRDPAERLIKPELPVNPPQPEPSVVLINQLKKLAGHFGKRLFNRERVAIEGLRKAFETKTAYYKRFSERAAQDISWERVACQYQPDPEAVFSNYRKDSPDDVERGIINHGELIEAFKKLRLERKIRTTPYSEIEKMLEKNNKVNADEMITNDVIRQAIGHLFSKQAGQAEKSQPQEKMFQSRQPGLDFSGIHQLSLDELKLYTAFTLLTHQHHYKEAYLSNAERRLESPRSQFALHAQYKYKLLERIQWCANELIEPHKTDLTTALRVTTERLENSDSALQQQGSIYSGLEEIFRMFISKTAPQLPLSEAEPPLPPSAEPPIHNQNDSDAACRDYLNKGMRLLNHYLHPDNLHLSLRVFEIIEIAGVDKRVSQWIANLVGLKMNGEGIPKEVSFYGYEEIWDSFSKLGLERKLRNLSKKVLKEISEESASSSSPNIVTKKIIENFCTPLLFLAEPLPVVKENEFLNELYSKFEKNTQGIELRLYAACKLYEQRCYQVWEKDITRIPGIPYTPFIWISHYQLRVIEEIKKYAQQLKQKKLDVLQEVKGNLTEKFIEGGKIKTISLPMIQKIEGVVVYAELVIRSACQLQVGYLQRDMGNEYLERLHQYIKFINSLPADSNRQINDIYGPLGDILEDVGRCYEKLESGEGTYINQFLQVVEEVKDRAALAAGNTTVENSPQALIKLPPVSRALEKARFVPLGSVPLTDTPAETPAITPRERSDSSASPPAGLAVRPIAQPISVALQRASKSSPQLKTKPDGPKDKKGKRKEGKGKGKGKQPISPLSLDSDDFVPEESNRKKEEEERKELAGGVWSGGSAFFSPLSERGDTPPIVPTAPSESTPIPPSPSGGAE